MESTSKFTIHYNFAGEFVIGVILFVIKNWVFLKKKSMCNEGKNSYVDREALRRYNEV